MAYTMATLCSYKLTSVDRFAARNNGKLSGFNNVEYG